MPSLDKCKLTKEAKVAIQEIETSHHGTAFDFFTDRRGGDRRKSGAASRRHSGLAGPNAFFLELHWNLYTSLILLNLIF